MGVQEVREAGASASRRACHRQRHPDRGPAGTRPGGQVRRSPAAVPPRSNLPPRRLCSPALNARTVGWLLWSSAAASAQSALQQFGRLYEVERELQASSAEERWRVRQSRSRTLLDTLHLWLLQMRRNVPDGSAIARAIEYSLRRWEALTRLVSDGRLPIDNNHIENQSRPIAIGRKNWLFAGSLRAGQRAAAVMSLVQSARMNGHDPYAYLRDVLERLPMQRASSIGELLPHCWQRKS